MDLEAKAALAAETQDLSSGELVLLCWGGPKMSSQLRDSSQAISHLTAKNKKTDCPSMKGIALVCTGVPQLRDPAEELLWGPDKPQASFPVRHRPPGRGSEGLEIFGGCLRPPNITVTISVVHILDRAHAFCHTGFIKALHISQLRGLPPHKY